MDALPLTPFTRYVHPRRQALAPVVGVAAGAGMLTPLEPVVATALAAALLAGALTALVIPVRKPAAFPASRYRIGRPDPEARPSQKPLSTDLSVAIAARLQPKTLARSVVPFLLVAPSGMAPFDALMMGLGIAAALYLHSLSLALMDCVHGAQRWSASLPLDSTRLSSHWRRAARIRFGVAGTVIAIPLFHAMPWKPALAGLFSMALWIETRTARWFGS